MTNVFSKFFKKVFFLNRKPICRFLISSRFVKNLKLLSTTRTSGVLNKNFKDYFVEICLRRFSLRLTFQKKNRERLRDFFLMVFIQPIYSPHLYFLWSGKKSNLGHKCESMLLNKKIKVEHSQIMFSTILWVLHFLEIDRIEKVDFQICPTILHFQLKYWHKSQLSKRNNG